MMIDELPTDFKRAIPVIEQIEAHGFEAYFVGGSVRDLLLGHAIHDVDIATSAFPEEIKQIFPKTIDLGIEHGTVLVLFQQEQYEITTFRTESTYQDYRRPDEVTFVRTLSEDLQRRDFTMNALAMSSRGEIIDLYHGIEAIQQERIIAVGNAKERFSEDALRMMRAVRFASQLGFMIEADTLEAIKEHYHLLENIAIERISVEFIKLLLGDYRNEGLHSLIATNCYQYCPGLADKKTELVSLATITNSKKIEDESLAWLYLVITLKEKNSQTFMKQWKTSNKLSTAVTQASYFYDKRLDNDWTPLTLYYAGSETISRVEKARAFYDLESQLDESLNKYEKLPIHHVKELAVTGKDILEHSHQPAGKWVGETIDWLVKQVVLKQLDNKKDVLLIAIQDRKEKI